MQIKPISIKQANAFVDKYHRHNKTVRAAKFCIAALTNNKEEEMVGVLVAAIPNARLLNDGWSIEFTRVCTDGTPNACSFLIGKGRRVAQAMGYKKIITYTRADETGASMKASNFKLVYIQKYPRTWRSAHGRDRTAILPFEEIIKKRWECYL